MYVIYGHFLENILMPSCLTHKRNLCEKIGFYRIYRGALNNFPYENNTTRPGMSKLLLHRKLASERVIFSHKVYLKPTTGKVFYRNCAMQGAGKAIHNTDRSKNSSRKDPNTFDCQNAP